MTFQKGIIITSTSLQQLYNNLASKYNVKYILTHRLNQDVLENLFSQIRTWGGLHDHPSPLNSLYRVRMILMGKNPGIIDAASTKELEEMEYILASTFNKAEVEMFESEENESRLDNVNDTRNLDFSSTDTTNTSNISYTEASISKRTESDGIIYIYQAIWQKDISKSIQILENIPMKIETKCNTHAIPSWVQHLSYGGLIQPSNWWLVKTNQMEKYFQKFHKSEFKRVSNIIQKTANYVRGKVTDVPDEITFDYCKIRIFMIIKYLNQKKKQYTLFLKRKLGNKHSPKAKKI